MEVTTPTTPTTTTKNYNNSLCSSSCSICANCVVLSCFFPVLVPSPCLSVGLLSALLSVVSCQLSAVACLVFGCLAGYLPCAALDLNIFDTWSQIIANINHYLTSDISSIFVRLALTFSSFLSHPLIRYLKI